MLFSLLFCMTGSAALAADERHGGEEPSKIEKVMSRLTVGGYGEAAYSYNMYSDKYTRYITPGQYKDESHGRFDLPHVVIFLGYDFGKGWTMGSEIEFEHGGTESAVEIEEEEAGEYESEVERGGAPNSSVFTAPKARTPSCHALGMKPALAFGAAQATGVTRLCLYRGLTPNALAAKVGYTTEPAAPTSSR